VTGIAKACLALGVTFWSLQWVAIEPPELHLALAVALALPWAACLLLWGEVVGTPRRNATRKPRKRTDTEGSQPARPLLGA
jgi:hypothetical protein